MLATLDKYGRIIIPKKIRKQLGITVETGLNIEEDGKRIIIEPISEKEPVVEEDGILVFTGKLSSQPEQLLEDDRALRMKKLRGKN